MLEAPVPELSAIRARTLLAIIVIAIVVPVAAISVLWPDGFAEGPLADALVLIAWYLLVAVLLRAACIRAGVRGLRHFGRVPERGDFRRYVALAVPLVLIAMAGVYALYLPLSFVAPEFVVVWLLDVPPVVSWEASFPAFASNLANVIVLLFLAPVVEEILFRGFLLNRWWQKYGLRKSVLFSSVAFGIAHVDILGGVVFAIVLSLLFVKTGSLIGPIVVHMSNNALVLVVAVVGEVFYGAAEEVSLAEFRSFWWSGALGLIVGAPWLWWFARKHLEIGVPSRLLPRE